MRASLRNRFVLIQSPGGTKNTVGERVTTWTTVGTAWAKLRPMNGREIAISGARQGDASIVVEMEFARAWAGITFGWRLLEGQRFTADATTDAITVAGPIVFAANDPVWFATSGTLPAPLTAGTEYFIKTAVAGVYTLSTTSGGATLNLTTAGSGSHVISPRMLVLDAPPTNINERDRVMELACSVGLRNE